MQYFTSESVGIGHPDKICDRISDAVLDECLKQDENSRVAVETMVTTQKVILSGEITTKANLDYEKIIRDTIKEIGYCKEGMGFDYKNADVEILIHSQSPDISQGVSEGQGSYLEQGAGDQGIMFGFATNETSNFMPLGVNLANGLVKQAQKMNEENFYLDCKSQVTLNSKGEIDTIVFSIHHSEKISLEEVRKKVTEKIIDPVCKNYLIQSTKILVNPTGRFVVGGPNGDTGVTGRKIIVDTYGGYARHGGGAFSGKDPSKVDRSAAYAARWVAKNVVAAGLTDKCEIQLSYAIGYPEPISIFVETFGTNKIPVDKIKKAIRKEFNLTPKGIIESLKLKNPIYKKTSFGGHFGREPSEKDFIWERLDKVEDLKKYLEE